MIPNGFLGTRGDLLTDLVVLSFVIILPVLIYSWVSVRNRSYTLHKRIQISLGILLLLAVGAFEVDIQFRGGSGAIFDAGPYEGTWWLRTILIVHLMIASITTLIWGVLIYKSLRKFPSPPQPSDFSATHKRWGTIGMVAMILTGLTAYPLYFFGFAA